MAESIISPVALQNDPDAIDGSDAEYEVPAESVFTLTPSVLI